jgi:PKD repeat protein
MKNKITVLIVLIILCLLSALVTSSSNDTFTVVVTINITANFTYQPQYPSQGGTVTFTDTSSPDTAINWSWNFGDGSISYQENPTHTYYYAGTYQVNFMVANAGGVNDTISKNIVVSSGGSGGNPSPPRSPPPDEEEEGITTSEVILEDIEEQYDIDLEDPFYANDTTGDGTVDTFTDPNGVLTSLHTITIDENTSFLISVNSDLDKLFIWDTEADTITQVTHSIGTIIDIITDADEKTITVTIKKTNWTYMEVTDQYPDNPNFTVKTSDGRVISPDMIWRENGIVYILDDPTIEYLLIYGFTGYLFDVILELTPDSVYEGESVTALITLINVGEPGLVNGTINYTLNKEGEVVWSEEENVFVLGQKAFNKTISTEGLIPGEHAFEVVYNYGDNQTANAQGMFNVNARPPSEGILLGIPIILAMILIIILIIVFLFKTGYLHIEKTKIDEKEKEQKDEKNTITKIKEKKKGSKKTK